KKSHRGRNGEVSRQLLPDELELILSRPYVSAGARKPILAGRGVERGRPFVCRPADITGIGKHSQFAFTPGAGRQQQCCRHSVDQSIAHINFTFATAEPVIAQQTRRKRPPYWSLPANAN